MGSLLVQYSSDMPPAYTQDLRFGDFSLSEIILSPAVATTLFVLACLAGHRYRRVWKEEGPRWQLWVSGLVAASCLIVLALVPLSSS